MVSKLIVVTDLDATLLDHHDYTFTAAMPAINRLRELNIPLILNSSKTTAEILQIRQQLQNEHPFIVENGSAVMVPEGETYKEYSLGMNRAEVIEIIHELRKKYDLCFSGFSDMNVADVVEHTGLTNDSAQLALQRQYTEPLIWQDTEDKKRLFISELEAAGLSFTKGGRFLHVSSASNKGDSLVFLQDYYQQNYSTRPKTIALGDSENDLPMLKVSDFPVLVKSPARDFPLFKHDNLIKTSKLGPAGWNQAVLQILNGLNLA